MKVFLVVKPQPQLSMSSARRSFVFVRLLNTVKIQLAGKVRLPDQSDIIQ